MHLFISHSSKDGDIAAKICETLERNDTKCFIAPRDIRLGREYAQELIDGIDNSFAMLLIMSENANSSPHVLREVERAVSKSVPILVYKIEEVALSKSMEYFLMTHQWTNAETDENFTDILRFADSLKAQNQNDDSETDTAALVLGGGNNGDDDKKKNKKLFIGLGIGLSAALICIILYFALYKKPASTSLDGQTFADSLSLEKDNTDIGSTDADSDGQGDITSEYPSDNNEEVENGSKKNTDTETVSSDKTDKDNADKDKTDKDKTDKNETGKDKTGKDKADKKNTDEKDENAETPSDEGSSYNYNYNNNDNAGEDQKPDTSNKDTEATPKPVTKDKDKDKDKDKPAKTEVKVSLGDTVTFGSYNKEDIEWRVLKISNDGKQAVLISSNVLCMKAFDSAESGRYNYDGDESYWPRDSEADTDLELQAYVRGSNIWKTSNLRTWLNTEEEVVHYADSAPYATAMAEKKNGYQNEAGFLNGFNKKELDSIVSVTHETKSNPLIKSKTITTTDRVYLLSLDELKWFDEAKISKFTEPTEKAIANDESKWWLVDFNEFNIRESVWWLREPVEGFSSKCYIVGTGNTKQLLREENAGLEGYGVRPALTVDLQKVTFKKIKKKHE